MDLRDVKSVQSMTRTQPHNIAAGSQYESRGMIIISVKNDPILMKFCELNLTVTVIDDQIAVLGSINDTCIMIRILILKKVSSIKYHDIFLVQYQYQYH